jgi:hypothetical protein
MRGITVGVTLVLVALVGALYVPTQHVGAQPTEKLDLEKAITGAKTAADHEAIASYYDREAATAKDKAAEHRRLAETYRTLAATGRAPLDPMGIHCQQLAQTYESAAAENTALAAAHRQMAQEATQKK